MTPDQLKASGYVEIRSGVWEKPKFLPSIKGEPEQIKLPEKKPTRLRQNSKPLMNKLETDFFNYLVGVKHFTHTQIHAQAVTFKIANGLRYTPDFFILGIDTAYEVKGKWVDGDSFPKLKMAASVFPEISWFLVWKDGNKAWQEQIILP
jgi:hypothetical protein